MFKAKKKVPDQQKQAGKRKYVKQERRCRASAVENINLGSIGKGNFVIRQLFSLKVRRSTNFTCKLVASKMIKYSVGLRRRN